MHKARRLLTKLRKQSSVQEVPAAHAGVQVPGAIVAQTGESGANADEVNVRINHEILQEAIEWAILLDGSRGASVDGSARNPLDHESLSKRLGLSFFIDLIPGGHLLVCAPLSYFKVYRPLLKLHIPEARRKALRTSIRKCMAADCAMGVLYLFGSIPRHYFGSNHRITQEGRRWVFEHADLCNQGFNDLYASQGPAPDSQSECPHTPMIQQVKRGRTCSAPNSYCERKPVNPVQPPQPASASGRLHPPQKAEWSGTLDDQLDYLLYTLEPAPLQAADTCAVRPSPVTEAYNVASECGTVQTSPPPPGEQPRRFVQNKRFSEKLYSPAAAARNAFYYHAAANNLERSLDHRVRQRAAGPLEDDLRDQLRQPTVPASVQRVSKTPVPIAEVDTYVVDTHTAEEQPCIGLLQDACDQKKPTRRSAVEEPLHIRRPSPLRIFPRMRNKDIPFTGPLLDSAIRNSGVAAQSTFRPAYGNTCSSSASLSAGMIATYSATEF
ncbi:unnamed protein product [Mortierella alpina]